MGRALTRQEARERLDQVYARVRDKLVPAEEGQAVKDGRFWEWEALADQFDRELTGALLEVLAGLSGQAALAQPGACPHCGSTNTKWLQAEGQQERQSKHGVVVLPRQVARCRPCGRSFSPAGAGLGSGPPSTPDAPGRREGGAGGGGAAL